MTLAVRVARPDEYVAVGALTAEAYRVDGLLDEHELPADAAYEEKLLDAGRRAREAELWVAVDTDGDVLGTVTWCPPRSPWRQLALADDQAEFRMLSVAPAGRRRGVARGLVEACLARALADGMTEVVIWSHPRMLGAHALYDRMGFERAFDLDGSPAPGVFLWGFRLALQP
jgi:GNAT superfamily N-acetyltransferase